MLLVKRPGSDTDSPRLSLATVCRSDGDDWVLVCVPCEPGGAADRAVGAWRATGMDVLMGMKPEFKDPVVYKALLRAIGWSKR